ncbi:MAG: putative cation efflux system protein [Firmicutes bacterium]|nr:putative cation efflux system protein [candidate division NPL-UPA2 bacterium]
MTHVPQNKAARAVATVSMATNLALTLAKAIVGILTGSTAVMADAAHSASDIFGTAVVLVGLQIGGSPPDKTHHYGHAKLESVAAKVVALVLVGTAVGLCLNAIAVLRAGQVDTPGHLAIWVTILSMIVKDRLYRYVLHASRRLESTALQAEALNHRGDAGASLAVLVGVVGAYLGYPILDPLAGILVAVLIANMGVRLYVQSVRELIDEAPSEQVLAQIRQVALGTAGVISITEVKARRAGSLVLVDLKLCVNRFLTVGQGHHIASHAKHNILEQVASVTNVLVHVNPCHHVQSVDEVPDCESCSDHTGI